MNPSSDNSVSGAPVALPLPADATSTRGHGLMIVAFLSLTICAYSGLGWVWLDLWVFPYFFTNHNAKIASAITGSWAYLWTPLIFLGPPLATIFLIWRRLRNVHTFVYRPALPLGVFATLPLATLAGLLVFFTAWYRSGYRSGEEMAGWVLGIVVPIVLWWIVVRSGFALGVLVALPLATFTGVFVLLAAWAWNSLELAGVGLGFVVPTVLWWGFGNRWRKLGVTAVGASLLTTWLVWDEPAPVTPLDVDVIAPPPPRAAESHTEAIWRATAPVVRGWQRGHDYSGLYILDKGPATSGEWRLFVVAGGDAIRTEWNASKDAREWIARLDTFDAVADLNPIRWFGERPRGKRMDEGQFIHMVVVHCAYASLLAVEQKGDEAMAVLWPILSVSRKIETSARCWPTYYLGTNGGRRCQNTAQFILQAAPPSATTLRQLAAVLPPTEDLATTFQRLFLCTAVLSERNLKARPGKPLTLLFFNPNATFNFYTRSIQELLAVARDGQSEGFRAHARARGGSYRTFKNAWGHSRGWDFHSLAQDVRDCRQTDDRRRALLAEVNAKLAAAEKQETAAK